MEKHLFLIQRMVFCLILVNVASHAENWILNNPYPASQANQKIYYSSFPEQPKTLDPAKSYSSNEYQFIASIYEPILQYEYLTRPYKLVPLMGTEMPNISYYDVTGREVTEAQSDLIARTIYKIQIQKGVFYQPHPAFAKDSHGNFRYQNLPADYLKKQGISQLKDFQYTGTREVKADDYIYEIKRLANPIVNSPIYGLMSEHIVGFKEFNTKLPKPSASFLDLRLYSLDGVKKIDDYSFEITIKGHYAQFIYWLAMPFFSPIPWEVDRFYHEPDMDDKNLSFGWYPVGTGPFMISENNPNSHIILDKNPNYHKDYFPSSASVTDIQSGFLQYPGALLPLIDKAIFTLEKESIPRWNKFLQGYYDASGISTDNFDQAIQLTKTGTVRLSPEMQAKGMRLKELTEPAIYYLGFNMLDPIVGGNSEKARKLRQAISLAIDYDENIAIFFNGRGLAAQGPIPPGIFGYYEGQKGINPYLYNWDNSTPVRRPIKEAEKLMMEAGYPNGRDPKTGNSLILNYDVPATGGPDDKEQLNWMHKQFARLGISLNIRATLYNRFQEKMRTGNAQIFSWGWNADYPDPENFLFLMYGGNGKVLHGGENATNYQNAEFDRLYNLMKNRKNDAERQRIIDKMVEIVRFDAPWVWGINTQTFILSQQWISPVKTNAISLNTLKYQNINVSLRNKLRNEWNKPILWPIGLFCLVCVFLLFPFVISYIQKQRRQAPRVSL